MKFGLPKGARTHKCVLTSLEKSSPRVWIFLGRTFWQIFWGELFDIQEIKLFSVWNLIPDFWDPRSHHQIIQINLHNDFIVCVNIAGFLQLRVVCVNIALNIALWFNNKQTKRYKRY